MRCKLVANNWCNKEPDSRDDGEVNNPNHEECGSNLPPGPAVPSSATVVLAYIEPKAVCHVFEGHLFINSECHDLSLSKHDHEEFKVDRYPNAVDDARYGLLHCAAPSVSTLIGTRSAVLSRDI